MQAQLRSANTN